MEEQAVSKLKSLDGIRGFAVLLVLLSHASNVDIVIMEKIRFSGAGHYGVFLFFVLSAFLLTRQFLEPNGMAGFRRAALRHYFIRRFLRIYPLFIVTLLVYWLLYENGLLVIEITGKMFFKSLLLLDAEGIFWTVPVEFQYYFILPMVAYCFALCSNPIQAAVVSILFCAGWTYCFPPWYSVHLIPFLPVFIIGSLTAFFYRLVQEKEAISRSWFIEKNQQLFNIGSLLFMLSFFVLIPDIWSIFSEKNLKLISIDHQFALFAVLSSGFIFFTLLSNGIIRRLMENPFFVFWGKVSFSAYLGHMIVLAFINELRFLSPTVQFFMFFSLTAILSYISYRFIERPLATISI